MAKNLRFLDFIARGTPATPVMPLVHSTTVAHLADIISSGYIEAQECKVYKEDLVYFFYGKPAYKVRGRTEAASRILGDANVTFVFDVSGLPTAHRVFAFDTGAAFGKRYDDYLPQGVAVDDLKLPTTVTSLTQLVGTFFQTNRAYFLGEANLALPPDPLDVASQAYADICRSAISTRFDDRACTCEVQLNDSIKIVNAKLLTVVMADKVYDDREVRAALKLWGVKPLIYRMRRAIPSERTELVYERLGDYYERVSVI